MNERPPSNRWAREELRSLSRAERKARREAWEMEGYGVLPLWGRGPRGKPAYGTGGRTGKHAHASGATRRREALEELKLLERVGPA